MTAPMPNQDGGRAIQDARMARLRDRLAVPPKPAGLVVIGAHGGAGASTVVTLLDPGRTGWAVEVPRGEGRIPVTRHPIVVARSTAYGVAMLAQLLTSWPRRLDRPCLVLVADAPVPPPFAVSFRLAALHAQISGMVLVPYLHRLRTCDSPADTVRLAVATRAGMQLRIRLVELLDADDGGPDA
ncbi:MAG: hypothetical protein L0Y54_22510 [Sporichthyaceae bacterium]|nr:hypothetical protein [Sporichthyaceae bacterium]